MRVLVLSIVIFTLTACKGEPAKTGSTTTNAAPDVVDSDAELRSDAGGEVDASVAAPPPPPPPRSRVAGCPEDVVDCCPYATVDECIQVPGCRNSYGVVFDERSKCWPKNAEIYGCVGLPTEEAPTPPLAKITGKDESGNCVMVKRGLLPFGVEPEPCGEGAPTCQ